MRHLTWLLVGLFGCPEPVEVTELVDEGIVCWQNGEMIVDFQTCLSSSCDTLVEATCTVNADGDDVPLESYARIESQGNTCTADCGFTTADCDLPDFTDTTGVTFTLGGTTVAYDDVPDCTF